MHKTARVHFALTEQQRRQLADMAHAKRLTEAAFLRELIDKAYRAQEKKK